MKTMLKIWILFTVFVPVVISQNTYDSDHLIQDTYDSDEQSYHPTSQSHQRFRSYEPASYEDDHSRDPKHYQSLEPSYHKHESAEPYAHTTRYQIEPQSVQYHQPEDPSYHRPQEIVYHQKPQQYQEVNTQHQGSYEGPTHYFQPEEKEEPKYIAKEPKYVQQPHYHQPEEPSYHRPQEVVYHQTPQHYPEDHQQGSYEKSTHHLQPEEKEDPKYIAKEPKYVQKPRSRHPAPVPTDPKLPLYFTMYEKRVIQDPLHKYGKGPWRYLTYGHGITYGSKEPGKVFEKGYGYIRALGRDHCKLPEHLCPPKDDKAFDYEGRKEPYFGYRPH